MSIKLLLTSCLWLMSFCASAADPVVLTDGSPEARITSGLLDIQRDLMPRLIAPERVGSRLCSSDPQLPPLCAAWQEQLLEVARMPADWSVLEKPARDLRFLSDMLFNAWADNAAMQAAFIDELEVTPLMILGEYALAKKRLLKLRETPWELTVGDADDGGIDLLAQARGRPVIVAFWSMRCEGSRRQIPKLKALYDKYQSEGLQIIGLTSPGRDSRATFEAFLRREGIPWPQSGAGPSNQQWFADFGFQWVSNVLLFDTSGLLLRAEPSFSLADWDVLIRTELLASRRPDHPPADLLLDREAGSAAREYDE